MLKRNRQQGFSMMEVLLGMTLGIASLAAIATLVGYGIGSNAKLISAARLNEELSVAANFMQSDIRRAGYNGNTVNMVTDPNANPSLFNATITIAQRVGEANNSCILYSYDENDNGAVDVGANNEAFGFRLNNEVIEWRNGETDCDGDGWIALTDSSMIDVTMLLFQQQVVNSHGIQSVEMQITIEGEMDADAGISRRIERQFVIRNFES